MIDISIYLASILIDVETAAVVPSLNKQLREVSDVAVLIVLHHSRGGYVVIVGGSSSQDHCAAQVDRAGLTVQNMLIQKITDEILYLRRSIT